MGGTMRNRKVGAWECWVEWEGCGVSSEGRWEIEIVRSACRLRPLYLGRRRSSAPPWLSQVR